MIKNIEFKENESLKKHTTFKIGGRARFYVLPKNIKQLKKTIKHCKKNGLKYFVLGNGSNVLASDKGFDGVIISLKKMNKIRCENSGVRAQSGVNLFTLNKTLAENSLSGMEWSYGIPATVGGAVKMNAGAYNFEFLNFVKKIRVLKDNRVRTYKNFDYSYRKGPIKDEIVLSVDLKLKKDDKIAILKRMKTNFEKRKISQPYDKSSAGSVFKRGKDFYPAKVIDDLGLKGFAINGAEVSKKHAGFIVNNKNARCEDVLKLIEEIEKKAKAEGFDFEREIIYLAERKQF